MANSVKIADAELREAAAEGPIVFLNLILDRIAEVTGDEFGAEQMQLLSGNQHALNAFRLLMEAFEIGGFLHIIQDGLGPYLFDNPFAKALRLWGAHDLSNQVYKAKRVFDANRMEMMEIAETEEQFAAFFDKFQPEFEKIDQEVDRLLPQSAAALAAYVDEHLTDFIEIV